MSKKPRFGIPANVKQSLSDTIEMVEDYTGIYTDTLIPIDRIVFDSENPRKLHIKKGDLDGPREDDPWYKVKVQEFESLCQLANSIRNEGLIHPVVVYKFDGVYRLVAGERRCLASIIAQKRSIEARVFNRKPTTFKLKLVQWAENNSREDLSLFQRISNMKNIIQVYKEEHKQEDISAIEISNFTNLSRSQVSYYLSVINADDDLNMAIGEGKVTNLDKAATISKIKTNSLRLSAIKACAEGASIIVLRQIAAKETKLNKDIDSANQNREESRGRRATKIHIGSTQKPEVAKLMAHALLAHPILKPYSHRFNQINWKDFKEATRAMQKIINILEQQTQVESHE